MSSESTSSVWLVLWTLLSPHHFQQVTFCRCLQISTAELKHQTFQHQYHNYYEELHTRYALCFNTMFQNCIFIVLFALWKTQKIPGKLSYICLFPEKTKSYQLIFFHFSAHKFPFKFLQWLPPHLFLCQHISSSLQGTTLYQSFLCQPSFPHSEPPTDCSLLTLLFLMFFITFSPDFY